jgi:hypothetical protein
MVTLVDLGINFLLIHEVKLMIQNFDYEGNWRDIFQNWEALAYSILILLKE